MGWYNYDGVSSSWTEFQEGTLYDPLATRAEDLSNQLCFCACQAFPESSSPCRLFNEMSTMRNLGLERCRSV